MLWWIVLGLGGLWAADRVFLHGAGSALPSSSDIQKAAAIALAKETKAENLAEFASRLQPVRPDLAAQLSARAHILSEPLVQAAKQVSTSPALSSKFTALSPLHH